MIMRVPTRRRILVGAATGGLLFTGLGAAQAATTGPDQATARGTTAGSGGVASGNTIEVPINLPINVCGNSVSLLGVGDTAAGNTCGGGHGGTTPPPKPCGCTPARRP
jgi:hypothetical protein